MGNISTHFNRSEFACKCGCGFDAVDKELLEVLEDVRVHFNAPVTLDCACRCATHNREVGGEDHSQHLLGKAADIKVSGHTPSEVQDYLRGKYPSKYGVGRYSAFTHIDVRSTAANWNG